MGINGFGRVGRQVLKAIFDYYKDRLEVVAVNDLTDTKTNAHLLKYDSNYGRYPGKVEATADSIIIDGKRVKVLAEKEPAKIAWRDFGVEIVVESSGRFTDGADAVLQLERPDQKAERRRLRHLVVS
jgi:glyceraldehyde 3-phosphate dehydrogenase